MKAWVSATMGVVASLALGVSSVVLLTPFTVTGADGQTITCTSAVFPNIDEYGALPCLLQRGEQAMWGWLLFVVGVVLLGLSITRWARDHHQNADGLRIVNLQDWYDTHDTSEEMEHGQRYPGTGDADVRPRHYGLGSRYDRATGQWVPVPPGANGPQRGAEPVVQPISEETARRAIDTVDGE